MNGVHLWFKQFVLLPLIIWSFIVVQAFPSSDYLNRVTEDNIVTTRHETLNVINGLSRSIVMLKKWQNIVDVHNILGNLLELNSGKGYKLPEMVRKRIELARDILWKFPIKKKVNEIKGSPIEYVHATKAILARIFLHDALAFMRLRLNVASNMEVKNVKKLLSTYFAPGEDFSRVQIELPSESSILSARPKFDAAQADGQLLHNSRQEHNTEILPEAYKKMLAEKLKKHKPLLAKWFASFATGKQNPDKEGTEAEESVSEDEGNADENIDRERMTELAEGVGEALVATLEKSLEDDDLNSYKNTWLPESMLLQALTMPDLLKMDPQLVEFIKGVRVSYKLHEGSLTDRTEDGEAIQDVMDSYGMQSKTSKYLTEKEIAELSSGYRYISFGSRYGIDPVTGNELTEGSQRGTNRAELIKSIEQYRVVERGKGLQIWTEKITTSDKYTIWIKAKLSGNPSMSNLITWNTIIAGIRMLTTYDKITLTGRQASKVLRMDSILKARLGIKAYGKISQWTEAMAKGATDGKTMGTAKFFSRGGGHISKWALHLLFFPNSTLKKNVVAENIGKMMKRARQEKLFKTGFVLKGLVAAHVITEAFNFMTYTRAYSKNLIDGNEWLQHWYVTAGELISDALIYGTVANQTADSVANSLARHEMAYKNFLEAEGNQIKHKARQQFLKAHNQLEAIKNPVKPPKKLPVEPKISTKDPTLIEAQKKYDEAYKKARRLTGENADDMLEKLKKADSDTIKENYRKTSRKLHNFEGLVDERNKLKVEKKLTKIQNHLASKGDDLATRVPTRSHFKVVDHFQYGKQVELSESAKTFEAKLKSRNFKTKSLYYKYKSAAINRNLMKAANVVHETALKNYQKTFRTDFNGKIYRDGSHQIIKNQLQIERQAMIDEVGSGIKNEKNAIRYQSKRSYQKLEGAWRTYRKNPSATNRATLEVAYKRARITNGASKAVMKYSPYLDDASKTLRAATVKAKSLGVRGLSLRRMAWLSKYTTRLPFPKAQKSTFDFLMRQTGKKAYAAKLLAQSPRILFNAACWASLVLDIGSMFDEDIPTTAELVHKLGTETIPNILLGIFNDTSIEEINLDEIEGRLSLISADMITIRTNNSIARMKKIAENEELDVDERLMQINMIRDNMLSTYREFAWKRLIAIYMFGMKYLEKKSFKREIGERTGLGYKLDLETYQLSAEDLRNNYLEITDELKR